MAMSVIYGQQIVLIHLVSADDIMFWKQINSNYTIDDLKTIIENELQCFDHFQFIKIDYKKNRLVVYCLFSKTFIKKIDNGYKIKSKLTETPHPGSSFIWWTTYTGIWRSPKKICERKIINIINNKQKDLV